MKDRSFRKQACIDVAALAVMWGILCFLVIIVPESDSASVYRTQAIFLLKFSPILIPLQIAYLYRKKKKK